MRRTIRALRLAPAVALGVMLGGCADYYWDRRDAISFGAGDDVERNKVAHIIDPWPRVAANRHITFDGQRMQRAADRYRNNKTTPLASTATSAVYAPNISVSTPGPSQ